MKSKRTLSNEVSIRTCASPKKYQRNKTFQTSKCISRYKSIDSNAQTSPQKIYGPYNILIPYLEHMKFGEENYRKSKGTVFILCFFWLIMTSVHRRWVLALVGQHRQSDSHKRHQQVPESRQAREVKVRFASREPRIGKNTWESANFV